MVCLSESLPDSGQASLGGQAPANPLAWPQELAKSPSLLVEEYRLLSALQMGLRPSGSDSERPSLISRSLWHS